MRRERERGAEKKGKKKKGWLMTRIAMAIATGEATELRPATTTVMELHCRNLTCKRSAPPSLFLPTKSSHVAAPDAYVTHAPTPAHTHPNSRTLTSQGGHYNGCCYCNAI